MTFRAERVPLIVTALAVVFLIALALLVAHRAKRGQHFTAIDEWDDETGHHTFVSDSPASVGLLQALHSHEAYMDHVAAMPQKD